MFLHIDIETYSSVDIKSAGVYKYTASEDFEILMVVFAMGDNPIEIYNYSEVPSSFFEMMADPEIIKVAHNASFERLCFRRVGVDVPIKQWRCTAVKASYCGLPMGLSDLTKVLDLGQKGKLSTGSALIRYFCIPVKATKANGGRTRNTQHDSPEKWEQFKAYCVNDVQAEREIAHLLKRYVMPESEWNAYHLDQRINDAGVALDLKMIRKAIEADEYNTNALNRRLKEITQLDNPNSLSQLKKWIQTRTGLEVKTLAKDALEVLLSEIDDKLVREVLLIRQKTAKTSIKKYTSMESCVGNDTRARGLFQFYGAGRTGRWAGRLIQLQNLPRNYMNDLDNARDLLVSVDPETFAMCYDVSDTLSQLIRTALVPSEGKQFAVADFSAIEARVIAWLAGEQWRLDVFQTHGKIYEASASKMFNVPLEQIDKGSDLRQKGKVAELALGYQGSVGALKTMGGEKMGLSENDMQLIVDRWRQANPAVCSLWYGFNKLVIEAVKYRKAITHEKTGIVFKANEQSMQIKLPSGRSLIYWKAQLTTNRFGKESVRYMGVDGTTKHWIWQDTYGGKIAENIVQAVARDLLLYSLTAIDRAGFKVVMHVHDEAVCEIGNDAPELLEVILKIMALVPPWAEGLPQGADGYTCDFYKKD